ncbi:hypothetical protein KSP39_PZI002024 [Platanthera zijinensis]|uniref:Uncharacterized protein n=1 Tax=Platanthera zijinensis TaxID=2320716 RepID=A0AAP0C0C4_9ASPA
MPAIKIGPVGEEDLSMERLLDESTNVTWWGREAAGVCQPGEKRDEGLEERDRTIVDCGFNFNLLLDDGYLEN